VVVPRSSTHQCHHYDVNGTEGCRRNSPGYSKDCKRQDEAKKEPTLPRECTLPVPPLAAVGNLHPQLCTVVSFSIRETLRCAGQKTGNMSDGVSWTVPAWPR
jgi:hypothetical protein